MTPLLDKGVLSEDIPGLLKTLFFRSSAKKVRPKKMEVFSGLTFCIDYSKSGRAQSSVTFFH